MDQNDIFWVLEHTGMYCAFLTVSMPGCQCCMCMFDMWLLGIAWNILNKWINYNTLVTYASFYPPFSSDSKRHRSMWTMGKHCEARASFAFIRITTEVKWSITYPKSLLDIRKTYPKIAVLHVCMLEIQNVSEFLKSMFQISHFGYWSRYSKSFSDLLWRFAYIVCICVNIFIFSEGASILLSGLRTSIKQQWEKK